MNSMYERFTYEEQLEVDLESTMAEYLRVHGLSVPDFKEKLLDLLCEIVTEKNSALSYNGAFEVSDG